MNKIITIIGIISSLILTGCDPELTYSDENCRIVLVVEFNEEDNMKMIGFNTIETNDITTVIINFKKNKISDMNMEHNYINISY